MLTVTAIYLSDSDTAFEQVDLFQPGAIQNQEKQERIETAMDAIRSKFGAGAIQFGSAADAAPTDDIPGL